jgi:hypothetical protein
MNDATIHRQFNPGRSPLLGLAAVVATMATLGAAVLLPASYAPEATIASTRPAGAQAPTQVVTLPAVEVVGTRASQSARNEWWNVPAVFRKNG